MQSVFIPDISFKILGDILTPKRIEKEGQPKPIKSDSFFANLFDAFKQAIVMFVMTIIYSIIPGGLGYLGFYLADKKGNVDFTQLLSDLLNDPMALASTTLHYGLYIMGIAGVLALLGFAAAFLYIGSRNDRIAQPLKIFKAYIATWKILLQFAIVIAIFGGIYFGITYAGIAMLTLIVGIICAIGVGITPLAMIFRVVDYLLELE